MSFTVVKDSYPNIVKDGLVLNVDAGSRLSYSGSGTTWSDISGNGNNGTLTNGPTYSSANSGSIVFDGVDDKVIVPYNSNLNPSNVTISVWFKRTSATNYGHFAGLPASNISWGNPYVSYGIEFIGTTDQPSLVLGFSNNTFSYTTATASASTAVGLWVNVVGTYDGSFSKIYVNGQLITSNAETRTLLTTSANFVLGTETQGTSGYPLNGNISNTQVYNRALSAAEILQNYNALLPRFYSIVTSGLVLNLDAGNPNSYSPPRSDQYASSLVLAVPMNGANNGTTFTDESATVRGSGTAKTITSFGDTKTVTSLSKFYGSSGFFDGSGDSLATPINADFNLSSGDWTIEFWVYPLSNLQTTFLSLNAGSTGGINFWREASTGRIYIDNGVVPTTASTATMALNAWSHLAAVRVSGTTTVYLNGTSIITNTFSPIASDRVTIGVYNPSSPSFFLNGYLQDLRIYKGVAKYTTNFKPPSISSGVTISSASGGVPILNTTDDYGTVNGSSGTTWTDISGNGNTGTLVNGPTYNGANYGSIAFDGTNQYGTIPYNSNFAFGTGDFTIEVWMRMTSTTNSYQLLGGTHSAGAGGSGWYYYARNAFQSNVGGGQSFGYGSDIQNNQSAISTNVWIQMVARRISGVLTFYQNTNQGASISFTDNIINGNALIIGNIGGSGFPTTYGFIGNISVVRVYKGIGLSATEVTQNFNALKWRYGI